jgi:hypothetical protein
VSHAGLGAELSSSPKHTAGQWCKFRKSVQSSHSCTSRACPTLVITDGKETPNLMHSLPERQSSRKKGDQVNICCVRIVLELAGRAMAASFLCLQQRSDDPCSRPAWPCSCLRAGSHFSCCCKYSLVRAVGSEARLKSCNATYVECPLSSMSYHIGNRARCRPRAPLDPLRRATEIFSSAQNIPTHHRALNHAINLL